MQKWRKLGRVFEPSRNFEWMQSHAAVPFAENIGEDLFKIYFSTRNNMNESAIGYVVININYPQKILELSNKPVLSKGEVGLFDDSGVMGSCILNVNEKKYLYYIGWNLGVTVPFRNAIGLAVSEDNGKSFYKAYPGAIIDRTKDEPHFVASSCVIQDENIFKAWYLSCVGWVKNGDDIIHRYHIKYAESQNAIDWDRRGVVAIDFRDEHEYALSVPRVLKEKEKYKMWFSCRASKDIPTYRIGYAESDNGTSWLRKDEEVGIDVSNSGWDSEMICYPFVFNHNAKKYMLYNGNDYGKEGFGLAVLED